jgi:hypothetical protein
MGLRNYLTPRSLMVLLLLPACSPQNSSYQPPAIHKTTAPSGASNSTDANPDDTSEQTNTSNESDGAVQATETTSTSTRTDANDTRDSTPNQRSSSTSTIQTPVDEGETPDDTSDTRANNDTNVSSDETDASLPDDFNPESDELDNAPPVETDLSNGAGVWKKHSEVNISPKTWHCQTSADLLSFWTAQNCVVIQNGYYQTAIVVRNRSNQPSAMSAVTRNSETSGSFECVQADISANDYWVCFGKTQVIDDKATRITAEGELIADGESYPVPSSTVEFSP